jgi:non-ribosomal peptide synthetase component F/acyl carrier protein
MVEHQALVNRIDWMQNEYQLSATDVVLQKTPFSFDVSVWEFTWPFIVGAPLVIAKPDGHKDPVYLAQLIQQHQVTTLHFVPSMLRQMLNEKNWADCTSIKQLFCSGEALPDEVVKLHYQVNSAPLHNLYGPTEAAIDVSYYHCPNDDSLNRVPIGKPIQNIQLYILNEQNQLQPKGVVGELHIGGVGLARGYLNLDKLTAERFINNPFAVKPGDRLYKTGDLARLLNDTNIEYVGRIDDQVKVRGQRIELGEIEHQLSALEGIKSAVVLAREDQPGNVQLVAYIIIEENSQILALDSALRVEHLQKQLQLTLPEHMIPVFFVEMDSFPVTNNGKTDKKALPTPTSADWLSAGQGGTYVEPKTAAERKLIEIWANLLSLPATEISADANFFKLGGHSLLSVRLVVDVRSDFGVELTIRDIFDAAILSKLASIIEQNNHSAIPSVVAIDRSTLLPKNQLPASFAQTRLWFIDQMDSSGSQYNMPGMLRFEGEVDEQVIEQAFTRIIERHEPLRTVFVNCDGGVQQVIRDDFEFTITHLKLDNMAQVQQAAHKHATRKFDLANELMLAASFVRLANKAGGDDEGILLLNLHHIACDGWSVGLLMTEFGAQYEAIQHNKANPYEPLAIQYADYAQWQRDYLSDDVLTSQLDYWDQKLADMPQVHRLPLDRARPKIQTYNSARHYFGLSAARVSALSELALNGNATIFMVLQSAFSLLLSRYSATSDVCIGVPVANRTQKALEPMIGFFVNTLLLRSDCSGNPTFTDFLQQNKTTNLDAQANQDVSFEYLVERLNPQRSTAHTPLFQIMFSMDNNASYTNQLTEKNQPLNPKGIDGLHLSIVELEQSIETKYELTLHASQHNDGIAFNFEYNSDLFDAQTIETLAASLQCLLGSISDNAQTPIHHLVMFDTKAQSVPHYHCETQHDYPASQCIHQLFEQHAEQTPYNTALVFEEKQPGQKQPGQKQLSYRQLNEQSNQLAHYLRGLGVQAETLVGISLKRSPNMVVAILAVLKAGGAYVPLDPNYPQSRLDYIVKDSGIKVILDDVEINEASSYETTNLQVSVKPNNLAYVIYTSGTTGQPKGVMVEHHNVVRLLQATSAEFNFNQDDVWTLLHSISFDFSVWEIWGALAFGGRLVVVPDGMP